MVKFANRAMAGKLLTEKLLEKGNTYDLVLALPRGGVPVAKEIADILHLPLNVFISRKLGAPSNSELAVGAIAEGDSVLIDDELIKKLTITDQVLEEIITEQKKELKRRASVYRKGSPLPSLGGKKILLVDDGVATGSTILAAIKGIKKYNLRSLSLAIPVCSSSALEKLHSELSEVICPLIADNMGSVGEYYEDFKQVTDMEVVKLLSQL